MDFLLTGAASDVGVCCFCELKGVFYFLNNSGVITAYKLKDDGKTTVYLERQSEHALIKNFSPGGFTASEANDCIYLGDRSRHCVHCIEAPDDDRKDWKMSCFVKVTKDNENPQNLSATPDGRLVVLVSIEGSFNRTWLGRLDIYRKRNPSDSQQTTVETGHLQTVVLLPKTADNPWCVTYSDNNTFIITYGLFKFGILKLNSAGEVIGQCTDDIVMPRCVKHVAEANFVYVLDSGKQKLLKFDLELKKPCVLYTFQRSDDKNKDGNENDNQPMRIAFSARKDYAIVGMHSGRVVIYKLSADLSPLASVNQPAPNNSPDSSNEQ